MAFYRGTDCCILVFDLTDEASFKNLDKWRDEFYKLTNPSSQRNIPFMLLGNKLDMAQEEGCRQVCVCVCACICMYERHMYSIRMKCVCTPVSLSHCVSACELMCT